MARVAHKRLIDRWLKNGRYYQFNLVGSVHKNPECGIADDVRIATEAPVEFAAGATSAVLSADMRAGYWFCRSDRISPSARLAAPRLIRRRRRAEASSRLRKCWRKSNSATSPNASMSTGPGMTLSGGEKQRLAFARLLLHRQDVIVLDEATAALDTSSQNRVIGRLWQELKDATVVSMGHRPELADFHHRKIVLRRAHGGAGLVSDVNSVGDADGRAGQRRRAERDSRTGRLRDAELAGIPLWA
jgi:ABC transporter